jgi:hypothetical protein
MKKLFIVFGLIVFMVACKHADENNKLIIGRWHYSTYSWKYFDKEMALLNAHLVAATDSNTHAIYADSIKLLNTVEEDSKQLTMEFQKDGAFFLSYQPTDGTPEAGKGTWKLFDNTKLVIAPYYPQNDTLIIAGLNKDSLVITGMDRGEPFKIISGKVK